MVCIVTAEQAAMRLRAKRTSLGFRTRAQFIRQLQRQFEDAAPSDRLLGALERGERDNYDDDTIRSVDLWYGLPAGTFASWIGRRDTPEPAMLDTTMSEPQVIVRPTAEGAVGEQGRLMPEERAEIVGALASIGQQLLELAQRIEAAGRDERP